MTRDEQTAISSAELQELVLPGMANHHGTLFAGLGLQLMAKAAFMAARKLARREVVMAGASGIDFMRPIPVGRTLALRAWVSRVGRSSMTVCISGFAEAPGARREEVLKGVFVMVAVDGQGRPAAIDAARAHAAPAPQTPEVSCPCLPPSGPGSRLSCLSLVPGSSARCAFHLFSGRSDP